MKYIVIGLGNYGYVLAEELSSLGHEVIGADNNSEKVEAIKDKIATAFTIDASDAFALGVLPLKNVDVVIVTIGEDFGASVRVVALLKQMKIEHIYARAIDDIHRAILEVFDIEMILSPEEDAARGLVQLLNFGTHIESFPIDKEHFVMKIKVTEKMIGKYINDLTLDTAYNLKLISITRKETSNSIIGIPATENQVIQVRTNDRIQTGDELICYGKYRDFQQFFKAYSQ